jgi:hypothetical protein
MTYTVHGSYENPKRAKTYARFTSKEDYATREEAEALVKQWQTVRDYGYVWIEEVKAVG